MQTVKILQAVMIDGKIAKPGAVVQVDNGLALNFVLRKRGEIVTLGASAPAVEKPAKKAK